MTTHPAAKAALATVVLDAAPLIASALADVPHSFGIRFSYTTSDVTVTARRPDVLATAFDQLHAAFSAAGWGMQSSFTDDWQRTSVSFQPPHLLTQTGAPIAPFPPR